MRVSGFNWTTGIGEMGYDCWDCENERVMMKKKKKKKNDLGYCDIFNGHKYCSIYSTYLPRIYSICELGNITAWLNAFARTPSLPDRSRRQSSRWRGYALPATFPNSITTELGRSANQETTRCPARWSLGDSNFPPKVLFPEDDGRRVRHRQKWPPEKIRHSTPPSNVIIVTVRKSIGIDSR